MEGLHFGYFFMHTIIARVVTKLIENQGTMGVLYPTERYIAIIIIKGVFTVPPPPRMV